MFKSRAKRDKEAPSMDENQGMAGFVGTPGQVITSANQWSGPYEAPELPDAVPLPEDNSETSAQKWGGVVGGTLGLGCMAIPGVGEFLAPACVMTGSTLGKGLFSDPKHFWKYF